MQPSSKPVWDLFRRRTFSQLVYWCRVLGYDFHDRSLTNRFYFIYFILFWGIWVVAVFFGLASVLAGFVVSLPAVSPPDLAVLLGAFTVAAWGLIQFWQVTGRSPFVFSEPDAYLLCQTPLDRRSVGLAWFLMDWFGSFLPFAAGAVLFSFTLVEASRPGSLTYPILLSYFTSSLRALAVVLPLQMGLQAGIWGVGALRLRRDRPPQSMSWLRLVVLVPILALLAAVFLPGWQAIVLAPLTFPMEAAFVSSPPSITWIGGEGFALLVLVLGLGWLVAWAGRIHLGRAAQETRLQASIRLAASTMNTELIEALRRRQRKETSLPPSRLPVRSGVWMLVWKDLLQTRRSLRPAEVFRWFWVFVLSVGMLLPVAWTVRLVVGALWAVTLGSLTVTRLRTDLARWWLLRSLPVRTSDLLMAELGLACVLGVLLGWLAVLLVGSLAPVDWMVVVLLPFLVASASLGTARDILDHSRARVLMTPSLAEENVPRQDIQGALWALVSAGIPLGLLVWGETHAGWLLLGWISLPIAALITVINFQSVLSVYRWIK